MASVFQRKYTVSVRGRKVQRTCSTYTVKWIDHGKECRLTGYEDEAASVQLGLDIERLVTLRDSREPMDPALAERMAALPPDKYEELVKHGLLSARSAMLRRPILEHIADYVADLEATGKREKYAYNVNKRLQKLATDCKWETLRDITGESFTAWRAENASKLSARTLNDYRDMLACFIKWLTAPARQRMTGNPLAGIGPAETRGKLKRKRRALTLAEIDRLIENAPKRALVYKATFYLALRRGDLKALRWGDVFLDVLNPYITTRAETCKGKREDRIPIRADLAEELRRHKPANAGPADRVFKRVPNMETFKSDLAKAGILEVDERGRRVDFHALGRTSPGTIWAMNPAISPAVHRKLMRHTDIATTHKYYVDADALNMQVAAEAMPVIGNGLHTPKETQTLRIAGNGA
ncbi:MAG TPA: tyrosine-type recombinase/integrase [Phycisphaerae bacterium]|nr:tyrosine-type recombinase/integrase [Phycisphaerae bacterium]